MTCKPACVLMVTMSLIGSMAWGATLQTPSLRFQLFPETGRYEITDLQTNVKWASQGSRLGQMVLNVDGQKKSFDLGPCELKESPGSLELAFRPLVNRNEVIRVTITAAAAGKSLDFVYAADAGLAVDHVRLLDDALAISAGENGYLAVPVREGLLIPADSGLAFTHSFGTYEYEGCHMAMVGLVKLGSAALVTWTDPYVTAEVKSTLPKDASGKQRLSLSMVMRKSAKACTLHLLGGGDYVQIAKAYRTIAKDKGYLVTWDQKLKENPHRAKYLGAINYKLWSALDRQMNDDGTKEERVTVNWTFDEAAQIAEHLKNDLKLDKVLFIIGGFIHRGYDNQHPDILPAAPECGGNEKLADLSKRVRALGYLFCLHDNYQDMYKDSPSWDESYLQKHPNGSVVRGGKWAGGYAYITCSKKAVELAKRPRNLPAIKKLTDADSYFIDTTYAAGLQECYDPNHPLTRADDMKWKQEISDYARSIFGTFGSECGREWAIPHADFFEGLTGVSGTYFHSLKPETMGATVIPLFELVYRDCIALYGKYGYDINTSAEYVLHHVSIARPMHYHSIPQHLYWKERGEGPLALQPTVAEFKQTGPRQFSVAYEWKVGKAIGEDWLVFGHITDASGQIKLQNDYEPNPPISQWAAGSIRQGPFTVTVPENLAGTFDLRVGLFKVQSGQRADLLGPKDRERRSMLGKIKIERGTIEFTPRTSPSAGVAVGDPGLFVRGDNGWTAGLHPMDRFVKNTYEVLSPLNEITARMQMTQHHALSKDRKVRQTVFGDGVSVVNVIVNGSASEYRAQVGGREVVLPPNGFVIDSPAFVAFCATQWNGLLYQTPTCFTLRSLDGKPLDQSQKVRIFHGFGDPRLRFRGTDQTVDRETTL